MSRTDQTFDPLAIVAALERNYVGYVLIGGLAQVLRGADLVTMGVDICPSFARDNLDRLARAVSELDAQAADGRPVALGEQSLSDKPVIELMTSAGELKVIASPAGVPNGYVDLRRAASREDLGHGLRPLVGSTGDLAAMAAALHRASDIDRLPTLRRLIELQGRRSTVLPPAQPASVSRRRGPQQGPRITP